MHAQGRNTRTALSAAIHIAIMTLALGAGGYSVIAQAQALTSPSQPAAREFKIEAGSLGTALEEFGKQSGLHVLYEPRLVEGLKAPAVNGMLAPKEALRRLLARSGLKAEAVSSSTLVLKRNEKLRAPGDKPSPAIKRTGDEGLEVQGLEKVVVVGSRLGVSPVDSAMPIQVITREQIDRSGSGNIAQVLSYLSEVSVNSNGDRAIGAGDGIQSGGNTNATTVQMRGMPRGTTLILINGRRAGDSATYSDTGQFDLSTIPLSLVERIEVLPAGSSAIYGGDGLAGVINIVLRRDANGLEVRYRQSHAEGYATRQTSIMWGKTWSGADLTIAANWSDEGSLYNSERSLTADQDYTRFGGRDLRTDSSNPATVYSLAGCPAPPSLCTLDVSLRGNLPGLSSPIAIVPAGSNGIGLTPADFLATQGHENRTSYQRHLRSAEENFGVTLNGRIDLSSSVEGFAELSHTKRDVPAYEMRISAHRDRPFR